ncbi:hypothetical protein F2Q69_00041741 [Brassica cretica]|uniref:Arabidopsis retrotransposon Orf1 C-terminal domain-containing protein n=1 Tax=Brassica cretica TaxID=69181 RepID=A0A8S9NPQ2_BRACR|nr:hypothetical protein F2Q69_00041741 [Brassica cretica]
MILWRLEINHTLALQSLLPVIKSDVIRATGPSRSHIRCPELESRSGSDVLQRPRKVARVSIAGSDVIRATRLSRSHIRCPELESRSGSDVSQRPREVARVSIAGSDVIRATRLSRSRFMSPRLQNRSRSDVPQRPREVARVYCDTERPIRATTPGTMVKKTKGKSDAERQEPESQESSLRGKALASERSGSGTQKTSRQKTVAAKKAKEQEKREGKSIAVATDEESSDESADEQAPTKRAKMSKGKEVAEDRDRAKTPSEEKLYRHLLNGVTWTPTRFADLDFLKEVGLYSDIEAMLGHLKMPKLLTMAYPTYRDVSCQFLSSLEQRREVAPAGSDVIRATRLSRSHILCPELESRSGSDVSQRPREVARVFCRWDRRDAATRSLAFTATRSDVTQRPRVVARVYCDTERPIRATPPGRSRAGPGTMVKKTKGKSDAERQEPESQESSLRGKALASERAGSWSQKTSRQNTMAAKKAKEQEEGRKEYSSCHR